MFLSDLSLLVICMVSFFVGVRINVWIFFMDLFIEFRIGSLKVVVFLFFVFDWFIILFLVDSRRGMIFFWMFVGIEKFFFLIVLIEVLDSLSFLKFIFYYFLMFSNFNVFLFRMCWGEMCFGGLGGIWISDLWIKSLLF